MNRNLIKQIIVTFSLAIITLICSFTFTLNTQAAAKSNTKIYCCLYKDGKLIISQNKIKPKKGKKVLESKKLSRPSLLKNTQKVKTIELKGKIRPKNCKKYFASMGNVKTIKNIKNLDTSKCTTMNSMFGGCFKLQKLDLSHFKTSNVTDMSWMFEYCQSLKNLNLSKFNTKKLKSTSHMFQFCNNVKSINLIHFNTSNITNI